MNKDGELVARALRRATGADMHGARNLVAVYGAACELAELDENHMRLADLHERRVRLYALTGDLKRARELA